MGYVEFFPWVTFARLGSAGQSFFFFSCCLGGFEKCCLRMNPPKNGRAFYGKRRKNSYFHGVSWEEDLVFTVAYPQGNVACVVSTAQAMKIDHV